MNQRLQQFLSAENISQSQFADIIGVARASVSHIISGRNKPGFDFIENMAHQYPSLNLDWLVTGKGKMYKESQPVFNPAPGPVSNPASNPSPTPVSAPKTNTSVFDTLPFPDYTTLAKQEKPIEQPVQQSFTEGTPISQLPEKLKIEKKLSPIQEKQRAITKIIVFFDDNTFQEMK